MGRSSGGRAATLAAEKKETCPLPLKNPLALQLYSGRKFPPLFAQLETISRCGFTHVETFGPLNDDPERTRRQLETFGLSAVSAHVDVDAIAGDPAGVARAARALKIDTIVAPYLAPERRPRDRAGWAAFGAFLAEQKRHLAKEGLRLVWHNHDFEFAPLAEGGVALEYILGEDLDWEADLAWVQRSGENPSAWIQRYRGRIPLIHVKDIAPPGENLRRRWLGGRGRRRPRLVGAMGRMRRGGRRDDDRRTRQPQRLHTLRTR